MLNLRAFICAIILLSNLVNSDSLHSSQVIYGSHFTPNSTANNVEITSGAAAPAKDVAKDDLDGIKGNNLSAFSNSDVNTDSKVIKNDGNSEEKAKTSFSKSIIENKIEFLPNSTITFEDIFPGLFVKVPLIVQSSFSKTIRIVSISSSDSRFIGVVSNTTLLPKQIVEIGYLAIEPARVPEINYMAIGSLDRTAVADPLLKSELQWLKQRETLYNQLKLNSGHKIHGVVTLTTDIKTEHSITISATLIRPSIVMDSLLDFSLVQVGTTSTKIIKVYNPADSALIIQVLPLIQESNIFKLIMEENAQLEVIPPKMSKEVATIEFTPDEMIEFSTAVYIKNNLTILDTVKISGQGGTGRFIMRTEKPNKTPNTFAFQVTKEDLKYCKQKPPLEATESEGLLITQNFQAVNLGNLPVDILSLHIDEEPCEGFGFRILNCNSFSLDPKQTQNISISYKPDFSASIVKHELRVATSSGPVTFSLIGVVPQQLLPLCSNTRPQSQFEGVLRVLLILTFLAVFSLVAYVSIREYQFNGNKYLLKPIVYVSKDGLTLDIDDKSFGVSDDASLKSKPNVKLADNTAVVSELAKVKKDKEKEVEKEKVKEKEVEPEKEIVKAEPPKKKEASSKKVDVEIQANHSVLSEKHFETTQLEKSKEKPKESKKEKEKESKERESKEKERELREKELREKEKELKEKERELKEAKEREIKANREKELREKEKEVKEIAPKPKVHKEREEKELKERKEKEHKESKILKETQKENIQEKKEIQKELPKEPVKDKEPVKKYRSQSMDGSNVQRPTKTNLPITQSSSANSQEDSKKYIKKENQAKSLSRSDDAVDKKPNEKERVNKRKLEAKNVKNENIEKPAQLPRKEMDLITPSVPTVEKPWKEVPRKEMDLITPSIPPSSLRGNEEHSNIKPILVKASEEPKKSEHNVKFQLENSTDHLAPSILDSPLTSDHRKKNNAGVIGSGKNKNMERPSWTRGLSLERLPSIPAPFTLPTVPNPTSNLSTSSSFLFPSNSSSSNSQPSLSFFSSNLQDTSSFFSFQPSTPAPSLSAPFDGSYQLFNTSFKPPVKTENQPLISQNQQVLDQQLQDSPFTFSNPFINK